MRRYFLWSLLASFAVQFLLAADQAPRPPQAPARVARQAMADCPCQCGCDLGLPCTCGSGCACGRACQNGGSPALTTDYKLAYAAAVKQDRPLIVWVGLRCPDVVKELSDYLHVHCNLFPGRSAPGVVVCKPWQGELYRVNDFCFAPTAELVRRAVNPPGPTPREPVVIQYGMQTPTYQPQRNFGSFFGGGGFSRGGSC